MNTRLRALSALGALAIVVGACSSGATPTPSSSGTAPSQPAPSTGESTAPAALSGELTIWHSYGSGAGTEASALKTVTDKIKAANPDLKLTIQDIKFDDLFKKFELEAASGGGPDLFIAPNDSLGKEARAGLFLDVTSMLDGKLANDSQVSIDGSKVDGKLYMVPESLKAVAMYYDKSKIATPPATTDALLAGVKDGTIKAGFDAHSSYHSFGWWAAFGGKLMDDSGKCVADTTGVADAYKYFQDLQTAGAKWYDKYDDLASDFKSGKIDLIVDGPWASGGYKDALKDNLAVAPIPAGPKGAAAAADRRRRLVHQHQRQGSPARGQLRPRDGQARERAGLRRHRRPHPGRQDDPDHRPDHAEVRRGGRDGVPPPAGRRSSTTSGATSTTP